MIYLPESELHFELSNALTLHTTRGLQEAQRVGDIVEARIAGFTNDKCVLIDLSADAVGVISLNEFSIDQIEFEDVKANFKLDQWIQFVITESGRLKGNTRYYQCSRRAAQEKVKLALRKDVKRFDSGVVTNVSNHLVRVDIGAGYLIDIVRDKHDEDLRTKYRVDTHIDLAGIRYSADYDKYYAVRDFTDWEKSAQELADHKGFIKGRFVMRCSEGLVVYLRDGMIGIADPLRDLSRDSEMNFKVRSVDMQNHIVYLNFGKDLNRDKGKPRVDKDTKYLVSDSELRVHSKFTDLQGALSQSTTTVLNSNLIVYLATINQAGFASAEVCNKILKSKYGVIEDVLNTEHVLNMLCDCNILKSVYFSDGQKYRPFTVYCMSITGQRFYCGVLNAVVLSVTQRSKIDWERISRIRNCEHAERYIEILSDWTKEIWRVLDSKDYKDPRYLAVKPSLSSNWIRTNNLPVAKRMSTAFIKSIMFGNDCIYSDVWEKVFTESEYIIRSTDVSSREKDSRINIVSYVSIDGLRVFPRLIRDKQNASGYDFTEYGYMNAVMTVPSQGLGVYICENNKVATAVTQFIKQSRVTGIVLTDSDVDLTSPKCFENIAESVKCIFKMVRNEEGYVFEWYNRLLKLSVDKGINSEMVLNSDRTNKDRVGIVINEIWG